jgi:hypothetical protein
MAAVTVGELLGLPAAAEHALVTHILKIKSLAFFYKKHGKITLKTTYFCLKMRYIPSKTFTTDVQAPREKFPSLPRAQFSRRLF